MKRLISFSSLRFKAMVAISGLIILTSAILGVFLFNHLRNEMRLEVLKWGETTVRHIANSCEYGVLTENSNELTTTLEALILQDDVVYAVVHDSAGGILAQFDQMQAAELVKWIAGKDFAKHFASDTSEISYREVPDLEFDIVDFTFPVRTRAFDMSMEDLGATTVVEDSYGSSFEKIGLVRIGISLADMRSRIYDTAEMIVLIMLVVTVAVIILTTLMVNVIIKPIDDLVIATERIAKGDLSHLVGEGSLDEISRLANAFNVMVESLRNSREEIEIYNRTLELKIAERTKELEDAQTQLVQSEKMSAIGELAAGVAHELNNPMGGILGYAQFALEKMSSATPGALTEKDIGAQRKYLSDIERQARRCRAIVRNLLKFSRSSEKKEWEEFDLNSILSDTISLIQHQLDLVNIELVQDFVEDLPHLRGSPSQLQQVFTNLLLNAQHAMPDGGEIRITTRLSPQLGKFSGCVEVVVEDNGNGIEQQHLKRIFEPFFTTKNKDKGTGLGLSISYGIVKEHGGDIAVQSTVDIGTRFTVILPLDSAATAAGTAGDLEQIEKALNKHGL
jgi:two-component system NtrC family sensor kinase